jgi:hypothetical protein
VLWLKPKSPGEDLAMLRRSHAHAILPISQAAYEGIRNALAKAGYGHQFRSDGDHGEVIDMHGLAVQQFEPQAETGETPPQ